MENRIAVRLPRVSALGNRRQRAEGRRVKEEGRSGFRSACGHSFCPRVPIELTNADLSFGAASPGGEWSERPKALRKHFCLLPSAFCPVKSEPGDALLYFVDDVVGRGCAGGEAYAVHAVEPGRIEILRALHEIRRLRLAADLPQVLGVRALFAADNDDRLDLRVMGQHSGGLLILFGRVADGVGALDPL